MKTLYKPYKNQYKSIIFYENQEEKELAIKSMNQVEKKANCKLHTEIKQLEMFYLAENYHQKYYLRMVRELMKEFEKIYDCSRKFIDSTVTAKVNGYIKGCGTLKGLMEEIDTFGLSEKGKMRLTQIVEGYGR